MKFSNLSSHALVPTDQCFYLQEFFVAEWNQSNIWVCQSWVQSFWYLYMVNAHNYSGKLLSCAGITEEFITVWQQLLHCHKPSIHERVTFIMNASSEASTVVKVQVNQLWIFIFIKLSARQLQVYCQSKRQHKVLIWVIQNKVC